MDWQGMALTASVWILPVLIAVTFHEAAHGWVAWRLAPRCISGILKSLVFSTPEGGEPYLPNVRFGCAPC